MAGTLVSIIFSLAAFHSFTSAMNVPPFANSVEDDICLQRDAIYKLGDKFANEACTGWCTCGVRGSVACVSLCPPYPIPECPPGKLPEIQETPSADPTGRCKCKRKSCFPAFPPQHPPDRCFHHGAIYKPGDRFADEACQGWCGCSKGGRVACVSLCPLYRIPECPPGKLPETQETPSADPTGRCTCKRKSCFLARPPQPPPEKLFEHHAVPECRNRVPNEWFINKSCTGRCKCQMGGIACVSLCPPMGVRCPSEEEKESYEHSMGNGRCTCQRERCVAKIGA